MLLLFWLRVSNETEESNIENFTNRFHVTANSPVKMQSQSPEVTINQQLTPETPKATTSRDNSDHPDVGVIPSTSNIITSHDYSQHHDVDVHPSTSNVIIVPPKRNLASIFDDIVPWPIQKPTSGKRKKEYTPSVITSDRWVQYHGLKIQEKMKQQKLKEQRKRDRELKREERNKKTTTKSSRKKQVQETSSEEEEWVESGSSIDDIDDENQ
ncbi:hypothetical protein JTB14_016371 [Gonioctena quinquepunctata]|nr:hypothetical protein JTB14_016371 [Gonioctena quinquepunctata]